MKNTLWQRLFRCVRRLRYQPGWERFAGTDWPEHIMHVPVTDRYHAKQGRTIGRLVLRADGDQIAVYLKRHYQLPRWRGLFAVFWPKSCWSPGLQEWSHLEWARAQGLPVPRALAGGEFIGPWGRLQSFIAIEELTDMLPLHEAIPAAYTALAPKAFHSWKRGLGLEMARMVHELHSRRWFHKDLYLCHFYIDRQDTERLPDWRGRVRLIDLHRLAHHHWTWLWWQSKDLAQLLFSSNLPGVTLRDRLWFWRSYQGSKAGSRTQRWLRFWIQTRSWSYHRHERRRRKRS